VNAEDLEHLGRELHQAIDEVLARFGVPDEGSGVMLQTIEEAQVTVEKLDKKMTSPWKYRWPDGTEEPYDRAEWYVVSGPTGEARVLLAHTTRDAWKVADRERYVVFARIGRENSTTFYPWTEFVQTDHGDFAALIPDPAHPRAALKDGMQLPTRFAGARVERTDAVYESAQESPTLRLVVSESDAETMIRHGYWVAELRHRLRG
jgi:hypothetical protein